MNPFVIDANVFIQSHRQHYPLDVAASFWSVMLRLIQDRKIISIDKVKAEITKLDGRLKFWVDENVPHSFFQNTMDNSIIAEYSALANWTNGKSSHFQPRAIDEFLDFNRADAWLVAFCRANTFPLVTYESSEPLCKSRIKLPDVCSEFSVRTMNPIKMFRDMGVTF